MGGGKRRQVAALQMIDPYLYGEIIWSAATCRRFVLHPRSSLSAVIRDSNAEDKSERFAQPINGCAGVRVRQFRNHDAARHGSIGKHGVDSTRPSRSSRPRLYRVVAQFEILAASPLRCAERLCLSETSPSFLSQGCALRPTSRDMSRDSNGATDSIVALNAAPKTRDAEYS
jgi:hypothetical protein